MSTQALEGDFLRPVGISDLCIESLLTTVIGQSK